MNSTVPALTYLSALIEGDRRLRHAFPRLLIERGGGRFLDQLLMPALNAAIALAEMDVIPVFVAEHLDLDVADLREEPLEIYFRIAERRLRLGRRLLELGAEFLDAVDDAHAAAAATATCLQQQREADIARNCFRWRCRGESLLGARHDRNADSGGGPARRHLVAHAGDGFAVGTDEGQARFGAAFGKGAVLGQKAVARIDRVAFRRHRRFDQRPCVQIAGFRGRRTDADRMIGGPAVG